MRQSPLLFIMTIVLVGCGGSNSGGTHDHPDAGDSTSFGYVSLTSAPTNYFSAAFYTTSPTSNLNCTQSTEGPCTFSSCTSAGTASAVVSAGLLTVTGGSSTVTLMPKSDGSYALVGETQPIFNGGETLTVTAAGDNAPAFTLTTGAPSRPVITSPATLNDDEDDPTFSRSNDLDLTWTGVPTGKLFAIFGSTQKTPTQSILCQFDGTTGAGTVPSSLLQKFATGAGHFDVYASQNTSMKVGDWNMSFTVSAYGVDSDGDDTTGDLSWQ